MSEGLFSTVNLLANDASPLFLFSLRSGLRISPFSRMVQKTLALLQDLQKQVSNIPRRIDV